ncbi:sensor histidine kinase [Mucilaginibacter pedocola]|uniref:histidine kinase n=1 Tax=Mucilaginibacter pedocola TaxID=1792845 RepID=A0A1S9PKE5_9SPHI|nr:hybrid sensor histidine kinase/response regulator [Mucilaginibacter pedocola]OOQ61421.1 hybrid sensor histidine kinase/response regulator [Mucilaginibacter pedocola]
MINSEKQPFTILLVDDRDENLVSLENILEAPNRIFLKARSGNEALKVALRNEDIGLIMLDVQMPDIDGFEVANILKSNPKTRDISIIFVTAINTELEHVLKGYAEGAVDYLQKPLHIAVTQSKVRVFEDLYLYQRELRNTIELKDKINKQLERFMFVVAHDLKSPLAGVVSLLQFMKDDERITSSEELLDYFKLMLDASTHLVQMIGSILEYSRDSHSKHSLEEFDVDDLVREMAKLLFPPSHISIEVDNKLPTIQTHKLKLQQVFQNLLTNAIKYNDKPKGEIAVGHQEDGEFYKFYVKDNGAGIAKEDQERIFNLFETTTNASSRDSSTGVGLNIMKMHVEEQGGKISVDSVPGEGSTFYFQWLKRMV